MKTLLLVAVVGFAISVSSISKAASESDKPGLAPYVPMRIEWLALVTNSIVRQELSAESPFSLGVVEADHETLVIFVLYRPTVNRESLNKAIDNARKIIMKTAKGYGWDKWVKIREKVEMR
jgi:hypothetical protein